MADPRKWGEDHISKSLKQIDSETWLVGGLVIHPIPPIRPHGMTTATSVGAGCAPAHVTIATRI